MDRNTAWDLKWHVGTLMDRGRAFEAFPLLDALEADVSIEARVVQSRLLRHLGNTSRSEALNLRTWNMHPEHPAAVIDYVRTLASRRGIYRAWQWAREHPLTPRTPPQELAEWHALRATISANLRDWETAGRLFAHAHDLTPNSPWILVEHAFVLAGEDRYDEAIDAARHALDIHGDYRSAVQALAQFESLTGKDEEAIDRLTKASARMQNADVEIQLASLLTEQRHFQEAWDTLQRAQTYSPLPDRARRAWFAGACAANLLARREYADALERCRAIGDPFHLGIADRLDALGSDAAPRRVLLDVGFVRQHFKTCAPATLSALSNFWGRPAEHVEVAEQICYDGTPHHSERAWTERAGFVAREFTVDWTVATQLIDAGIPFTLTTRSTHFAHLQAVIGYDEIRRTLLIRDPTQRVHVEFDAQALFEAQRAFGPRGMLVMPAEEAHRIAHIALPEADDWDSYHGCMMALERHDRASAQAIADAQDKRAPGHWLTIWCLRSLALYDGGAASSAHLTKLLIERFGPCAELLLQLQHDLGGIETRSNILEAAQQAVQQHPRNAALVLRLANLQSEDARNLGEARHLVTRALRVAPADAIAWKTMADVLWLSGDRRSALEHYRIAAALDDRSEDLAAMYCRACHAIGEGNLGLSLLAERQRRLGDRAAGPTITYFCELENRERTAEAFAMITEAQHRRQDDDELRLFCAQKYLQHGEIAKAKATLAAFGGRARSAHRLSVDASLAHREGRVEDAWAAISRAVEQEPLRIELRRQATEILCQLSGRRAVIEYLRGACTEHSTVIALHTLLLEWLGSETAEAREMVVRHVLSLNESNAHMWRELAIHLANQHKMTEAWEAVKVAGALAPHDPNTYAVRASLHFAAGDIAAGQEHCREALRLSVDHDYAFNKLVTSASSHVERCAALEFVRAQLMEQAACGNALLRFQAAARASLPREELLAQLEALRARRPELWQAWLAPALQRMDSGQPEQARVNLEAAVERFPFTARLHYEMARVAAIQGRPLDARESVRRALQIEPAWEWAIRLFVELALKDPGQLGSALQLLDSPLSRSADSAECQVLRGKLLWKQGRFDEAVSVVERALQRWPAHAEAWELVVAWARQRGCAERIRQLALRVIELHPHDPSGWIRLADCAPTLDEAISASDHAVALSPFNQLAYTARLNALMRHERFDEVLDAVRNAPWGEQSPTSIRRYAAHALWAQRKADEAFAALRELLRAEPNDFLLWQDLAGWLDTTQELDEHLAAAQALVRIAPGAATAHGHLGHVLRKRNEIDPAIDHFRTALELNQDYAFAGFALVDLLIEHRLREAAPSLAMLRSRFPGPETALRELRYACTADDSSIISAALGELIRAPESQVGLFLQAAELLQEGERRRALLAAIGEACMLGEASEAAIHLWLNEEFDLWNSRLLQSLEPYLRVDRHHRLKIQLIESAAKRGQRDTVLECLEAHGQAMRSDPRNWGAVSFALVTMELYREAIEWMHDWQRQDAPWWALDNLALAMRSVGMHDPAHAVSIASQVHDSSRRDATVWLAIDAALCDDVESLRSYLHRTEGVELRPYYSAMRDVASGYLRAVDSGRTAPLRHALAQSRQKSRHHRPLAWARLELRSKWVNRVNGFRRLVRIALL